MCIRDSPITGTSKWLERLVFLVLIWVLQQVNRSRMNRAPYEHYSTAAATVELFLHTNACDSKLGWQCRFLRIWPASRMAQRNMRKSEIKKNLQLLSDIGETFQPLGAPPDFTTNSNLEAWYSVMSQAHWPLISWISCSKSWLPYYLH